MCGSRQEGWSLMVALVWGRLVPVPWISQWRFLKRSFYSVVCVDTISVSNSQQNLLCTSKINTLENIYHSKTGKWAFCFVWFWFLVCILRNNLGNSLTGSPKGCLAGFQLLSVSGEARANNACSSHLWFLVSGNLTVAYHSLVRSCNLDLFTWAFEMVRDDHLWRCSPLPWITEVAPQRSKVTLWGVLWRIWITLDGQKKYNYIWDFFFLKIYLF